jgi:hypothetical protein
MRKLVVSNITSPSGQLLARSLARRVADHRQRAARPLRSGGADRSRFDRSVGIARALEPLGRAEPAHHHHTLPRHSTAWPHVHW